MRIMSRITLCLSAVALAGACAPASPAPATMVIAADSLDKQFLVAFNNGDADALMALYWKSPDLVSIGLDGMGVQGWDAARASWDMTFKNMRGARLEFTEAHNTPLGETVLGWGRWKATIPAGAGPQEMEGRYSDVKALRDGRWVYVMDHGSVPMPPPPPAPPVATPKTK